VQLLNRVKALTTTAGTGSVTPSTAVAPFQTWAAGGAVSGVFYSYLIEDGSAWELGTGLYNGTTITRPGPGTDPTFASSTGSLLSLSGAATVACAAARTDYPILCGKTVATGVETVLTVSNIPAGWNTLEIEVMARQSGAVVNQNPTFQFNGLGTGIYNSQRAYWQNGTGGADQNLAGTTFGNAPGSAGVGLAGASAQAGQTGYIQMRVFGYAQTTFNKCFEYTGRQPNSGANYNAYHITGGGEIATTGAINSVAMTVGTGTWVTGSYILVRALP
jgi:hypothetical protein